MTLQMTSRAVKTAYYGLFHYPMRLNALRHRILPARIHATKAHLGPGQRKYLKGWINVDSNFVSAKIDIWADVRATFPFRTAAVEAFYSHHVIEHLRNASLAFHFSEMFRCLVPGGVIRIGVPNVDVAIKKYAENDLAWFDYLSNKRRSIGGQFANFVLCEGEHLTILTSSYLEELATDAGFSDVHFCQPQVETSFPAVFDAEVLSTESDQAHQCPPYTLVMEATKPAPPKAPAAGAVA